MALPDLQEEAPPGPSAVAEEATEARRPLPGHLLDRAAWMGLGALASVVVASVAFMQGAWTGGAETTSTANSVQADQADRPPAVSASPSDPGVESPDAPVPAHSPSPSPPHSRGRKDSSHTHGAHPAAPRAERTAANQGGGSSKNRTTGGDRRTGSSAGGSRSGPADQAARSNSGGTSAATSTAFLSARGVLSHHSDQYWDEDTVTVRITEPATALKVTVRIVQTGGVVNTSAWSSLGNKVTYNAAVDNSQLAYVVTLKPGVRLNPGTYTFDFGFNHDKGLRNAAHDLWAATVTAGSGRTQARSGHFS